MTYKYARAVRPAARVWRVPNRGDFSIVVADGPLSETKRPTIHPAEFAAATELSGTWPRPSGSVSPGSARR